MALSKPDSVPFLNPEKTGKIPPAGPDQSGLQEQIVAKPPQQALARLQPEADLTQPSLEVSLPLAPELSSPPSTLLAPPPEQVATPPPLYLRNPGPPPRLPRNWNVNNLGRSSYRFREIGPGKANRRPLLWLCALLGIGLLYVLLVMQPQRQVQTNFFSEANQAAQPAVTVPKSVLSPVGATEQYALVMEAEGKVLEEPRSEASQVQTLKKYTFIALQRKHSGGWYQLKGGSGWIASTAIKTYPTEEAAWKVKRELEKS